MPQDEMYLEIGTLEGRTLEAAAHGNDGKTIYGVDPCEKYDVVPEFGPNVTFVKAKWEDAIFPGFAQPIGLTFYDADHSAYWTAEYMLKIQDHLADEAVLVLDDWDRITVRDGAFAAAERGNWHLLREMPEYGDGLTCPQSHFGYSFGVSVWGFKR